MRYEPIEHISRGEAAVALASGDRDAMVHALIGLAMYEDDWRWAQQKCVEFSDHHDVWVRRACATGLLHIARVHRRLDMDSAMVVFERLLSDRETAGEARDTLDEIRAFLRRPVAKDG
jgi:hypothetical protein